MSTPTSAPTSINAERFWFYVEITDDCWWWKARCFRDGYGSFQNVKPKRPHAAHRIAWILTRGPIPEGSLVLHNCDTRDHGGNPLAYRRCVNPDHLFLGTHQINALDREAKGRGHPFWPRVPKYSDGRRLIRSHRFLDGSIKEIFR